MVFLKLLEQAKNWEAWIDTVKKKSTYIAIWKKYMKWEYSPTLTFQAYMANYGTAAMASVIKYGSGKPIRTRPSLGELTGTIPSLGDKFQMDALMIRKALELEEKLKKEGGKMGELYDFLFPEFEEAMIAPHKRLDHMTLQGMSEGKIIVNLDNNPEGVQFELNLGVKSLKTIGKPWATNDATSTPLTDIRKHLEGLSFTPDVMRMTSTTFAKMIASAEFKNTFSATFGRVKVDPVNVLTTDMVNQYLGGVDLPVIEIMKDKVAKADGTEINPFANDRVCFAQSGEMGAVQYTYANEQRMPEEDKNYRTVDNVLLAYGNKNGGRFLEYELNAIPAFTKYKKMAILDTSTQES